MKVAVEEKIIQILKEKFELKENVTWKDSLLENGIVDRGQMSKILSYLEEVYHIKWDEKEIDYSSIDTTVKLAEKINEKLQLENLTLRDLFLDICQNNKENLAIIFDGIKITYAQLQEKVEKLVTSFTQRGVEKGTLVGIIMSNRMEFLLSYFSLFYIGALPVPINTRWKREELYRVLEDTNMHYIIVEQVVSNIKYGQYVSDYHNENKNFHKVFYLGENLFGDEGESFEELSSVKEIDLSRITKIAPKDPALISYTSGTTGMPKGVMLRHNDLVKISKYASEIWYDNNECPFAVAPLYAAQGFLGALVHFCAERTFKMNSTFNPNDILKEISKCEDTTIHTQPTMWNLLLNCRIINFTKFDKLNLLIVSGSLCSPALAKRIEEKLGCVLVNAYGLIEATSVVTMTRREDSEEIRYNTVGRPIPGVEIKIVDQDRKELKKGEIGELAVKGYNMIGYYHKPEKTAEIIDSEGWLYTGDLAKYYDDENISIVGRCKDMIIRGGFNVYPSDIEEYIMQLEQVESVAVIGKENEILGEEIVAYIVLVPGAQLQEKDVKKYLFEKIANYKMPDKIYFISEMPIILAGKIDKRVLKDWTENGIPAEKQILFKSI